MKRFNRRKGCKQEGTRLPDVMEKSSSEHEIWGVLTEVEGTERFPESPELGGVFFFFSFLCFLRRKKAAMTLWMGRREEEIGQ